MPQLVELTVFLLEAMHQFGQLERLAVQHRKQIDLLVLVMLAYARGKIAHDLARGGAHFFGLPGVTQIGAQLFQQFAVREDLCMTGAQQRQRLIEAGQWSVEFDYVHRGMFVGTDFFDDARGSGALIVAGERRSETS